MTTPGSARRTLIAQAIMLLSHYGFDTKPHTTAERMGHWLEDYDADWIRTAIIEALYQGRYKAISVEHILSLWQKRGRPSPHFTGDFERIICRKLPEWYMTISTSDSDAAVNEPAAQLPVLPTTAAAPAPVITGVQRWRQLAQAGQPSTDGEGMIARLRSFAYLDMTALPQQSAIAPTSEQSTDSDPLDTDPLDTDPLETEVSDRAPADLDSTPDSDPSILNPAMTANSDTGAAVSELEESDTGAAVNELEESEAVGDSDPEPSTHQPDPVDVDATLEPAVSILPVADPIDATDESDRSDTPTHNLLLLSQPQTVKPRPILDLPNPNRNSPTFRSGIRTFIPAVGLSPFLVRLLQFYATLPEPGAVEPMWESDRLPVSLERS